MRQTVAYIQIWQAYPQDWTSFYQVAIIKSGKSWLDGFVILFDHHICGNWVTTKDDLSPIFSPKTASFNIK